ncbi:GA-binding protein subunit beta-1 [Octopus bimaculoides]|uniref:Uncharacterized protein n=1 Tax=Octopus bimaculoides TaxID=37653 RepID=A0A0L8IDE3_OCTBM|nr:GA-binding protein subunit beta-1 [Octopus bimaculoides]XP_014775326.1 GA-binding protein subunit beta-1 [Octopus bimaculoides]|eukprot:XP_014775317.1 PREDICTED: GA-binding protein subunit beta-1-like [Octopus bimaculoides]
MPYYMESDTSDPSSPFPDDCRIDRIAINLLQQLHLKENNLLRNVNNIIKYQPLTAKNIFTHNIHGWTFAHACVLRGNKELVEKVLDSGISINSQLGESTDGIPGNCTLLHIAAYRGDPQIVEFLVSRKADISAEDSFKDKPIAYARHHKHHKVIAYLEKASQKHNFEDNVQKRFKFFSNLSNRLTRVR